MKKDKKAGQQKWAKFTTQKQQEKPEAVKIEQQRSIVIITHTFQESQAQVLLPREYEALSEKDLIVIETRQPIVVQVCRLSKSKHVQCISILKHLADMSNVEYQLGGKFKSTIRLDKPEAYPVEFVELIVKEAFMSRRDQYKILDQLNRTLIYVGKVLNFQGLKLTVMTMMGTHDLVKRGVISLNTKIIYRTSCSKYKILLELSKQTFELDINQETYVEKTIQFIMAFSARNAMSQNTHRVHIILFSRLYYPQVKSLNEAYDAVSRMNEELQKSDHKSDKYSLNFAMAFQIDPFGNIYEDVYRKIFWKKNYGNLNSYIWKKIGEFLYTINWRRNVKPFAEFILKRVRQQMDTRHEDTNSDNSSSSSARRKNISGIGDQSQRIRPFLRFLECELSDSRHCNVLEAINLTADQFSKHYYGRNLCESGSAITILTAGHGKFYTDPHTYRLAKSSVYLNNISCVMICVRNGVDKLQFIRTSNVDDIVIEKELQQRPSSLEEDLAMEKEVYDKLNLLLYDCLDEYIYSSPVSERAVYDQNSHFKNRIGIRGSQSLKAITIANQRDYFTHIRLEKLKCTHNVHYVTELAAVDINSLIKKKKSPRWIEFCNFSQDAFKMHQHLYDKAQVPEELRIYETSRYNNLEPQQKIKINKVHQTFDRLRNQLADREFCSGKNSNKVELRLLSSVKKQPNGELYFDSAYINADLFKLQVLRTNEEGIERALSNSGSIAMRSQRESVEFDMLVDEPANILMSKSSMSVKGGNQSDNINIFDVEKYEAPKYKKTLFTKSSHRKYISHFQSRLKFNYRESKINMLMSNYKEPILRMFRMTLHRNDECPAEFKKMFVTEAYWKLVCFPVLTPIKTAYDISKQNYIQRAIASIPNIQNLEEMICQKLSQNFQLVDTGEKTSDLIQQRYHLAKGSLYHHITVQDRVNLNISQRQIVRSQHSIQDKNQDEKVLMVRRLDKRYSSMMYRYLCYEEKEYRFVGRHSYFSDPNCWKKDDTAHTKNLKVSFVIDTSSDATPDRQKYRTTCRQNFRQFIQAINEKYQGQIKDFPIVVTEGAYKDEPKVVQVRLSPYEMNNKFLRIYQKDEFLMYYESTWNIKNTFNVEIEWSSCMSIFIADFLKYLLTMGKFNKKILPFMVPSHSPFEFQWSFESPAQILFDHYISIELMETIMEEEWVWDRLGYYLHRKGFGFVKFYKQKKLLLWKDNMREIMDANQSPQGQFYSFFRKACSYDILGSIIESIFEKIL